MAMREFVTTSKTSPPPVIQGGATEFQVDGVTWTAYPPTGGQLALMMAAQSEYTSPVERIKGLLDFLDGVLDEEARMNYRERLLDRDDPFDFDDVEKIIEWLSEDWAARPTKQPSVSPSSRRRGGLRSTGTPPSAVEA